MYINTVFIYFPVSGWDRESRYTCWQHSTFLHYQGESKCIHRNNGHCNGSGKMIPERHWSKAWSAETLKLLKEKCFLIHRASAAEWTISVISIQQHSSRLTKRKDNLFRLLVANLKEIHWTSMPRILTASIVLHKRTQTISRYRSLKWEAMRISLLRRANVDYSINHYLLFVHRDALIHSFKLCRITSTWLLSLASL